METNYLQRKNREIRNKRPWLPAGEVCDVFYGNNLVEICFLSRRCRNDLQGSCIMCDYGVAEGCADTSVYIHKLSGVLAHLDCTIDTILLSTNGSFFDESQIPSSLFLSILEQVANSNVKAVEIETHYRDVTAEKLELFRKILPNKKLFIEMGLETINPLYQSCIIMKGIELSEFERSVSLIQSMGINVECNVMVGLPFLFEKEQYEDVLKTIYWVFDHQCAPVLFPINIKPYTLLMDIYQAGFYTPVSHWMIPIILDTLPIGQLSQVTIAWYGNREDIYPECNMRTVFPVSCDRCGVLLEEFYYRFSNLSSGEDRKRVLVDLFSKITCSCLNLLKEEIKKTNLDTFEARYSAYIRHSQLKGEKNEESDFLDWHSRE